MAFLVYKDAVFEHNFEGEGTKLKVGGCGAVFLACRALALLRIDAVVEQREVLCVGSLKRTCFCLAEEFPGHQLHTL